MPGNRQEKRPAGHTCSRASMSMLWWLVRTDADIVWPVAISAVVREDHNHISRERTVDRLAQLGDGNRLAYHAELPIDGHRGEPLRNLHQLLLANAIALIAHNPENDAVELIDQFAPAAS